MRSGIGVSTGCQRDRGQEQRNGDGLRCPHRSAHVRIGSCIAWASKPSERSPVAGRPRPAGHFRRGVADSLDMFTRSPRCGLVVLPDTDRGPSLTVQICLAQDTDADQLLTENPLALVVGIPRRGGLEGID